MQKEEIKKEIEELKTIVMNHIRTASNLDTCIQLLEEFIEKENDSIYIQYAIGSIYNDRMDMMRKLRKRFNDLDETERLHWETLLKIVEES